MSSPNTLVINCDLRETRVALIEDGVIAELQIERAAHRGTVGNIVLGKVSRVLPGMQAAFIDVGMERAAFLHVEDLIRPDDFEAYLAGDYGEIDKSDSGKDAGRGPRDGERDDEDDELLSGADDSDSIDEDDEGEDHDHRDHDDLDDSDEGEGDDDLDHDDDLDDSDEGDDDLDRDDDLHDELDDEGDRDEGDADDEGLDEDDEDDAPTSEDDFFGDDEDEDEEAIERSDEQPEELRARAQEALKSGRVGRRRRSAAPPSPDQDPGETSEDVDEEEEEESRGGGGRRRRRRRRPTAGSGSSAEGRGESARGRRNGASRSSRSSSAGGGSKAKRKPTSRVSRSVPITEVVKEGDQVVVQISKEPIGTKGARVTSHVSLPGRYCVFLPTVDHIGISKRIGSASERSRLRKVIDAMKPKTGGIIVRTVAAGLTKKSLKADLGYLMRLWSDVSKRVESAKSPTILYDELDLVLKTARDLFTDDIDKIVIDDKDQYARLVRFVEMFLPERVKDIELYQGDEPIFDAYGIEDEITRALSRKVPLASGGYLIMDQAEALSAIDVNTGRFVGKGSGSLEETALKTNLEAVDEIAYQLRFRNVGGLVVLDLIDMEDRKNREKVYRALDQALKKDKAKTTINRISDLGLIEMTRKRTRESLSRTMHEPCFYCDGTGQIQSRTTIAYEILRQMRRERQSLPGYSIVVNAHPAVIDLLQSEEKESIKEAEGIYMRRIKLVPRKEYHIEQFDLQGS